MIDTNVEEGVAQMQRRRTALSADQQAARG